MHDQQLHLPGVPPPAVTVDTARAIEALADAAKANAEAIQSITNLAKTAEVMAIRIGN
jgi:hypothetical protein